MTSPLPALPPSPTPRKLRFDPTPYRTELIAVLRELGALVSELEQLGARGPLATQTLQRVLRRHPKDGSGLFSRAELIAGFRAFARDAGIATAEKRFVERIQMRPVRTQSGVTPITVLTKPFPCPGECVFCPNDLRMPKSYLSREPGAQRAEHNQFDPYLQTYNRLLAFAAIGHPLDKAELIVLGGTWSSYPESYQRWFIKRCFDALNDLASGQDRRAEAGAASLDHRALRSQVSGLEPTLSYNRELSRFLLAQPDRIGREAQQDASWEALAEAQRQNEIAACRNVGLSVETRPDRIDEGEVLRLRRLGCTKLQIGVQSLSDRVLALNKRGHDLEATRRAFRLLRGAGFKIQAHIMPNLLGATPELDIEDYLSLFADADFRPDELKLYPCSLIESAELMRFHQSGEWRPYAHEELLRVLCAALAATPRYCRLSRVIRDISSSDIVAGNRMSNLRELAEQALRDQGTPCVDIRSREIGSHAFELGVLRVQATCYESAIGQEQFLELCTPEDRVVAFLRLSLPEQTSFVPELAQHAVIRELHVYGPALALGARDGTRPQHRGLGRWLIDEAVTRARAAGFGALSVISAVGTRPYYRRLGFEDGALYQQRAL
jgi:elongator complex protein 3